MVRIHLQPCIIGNWDPSRNKIIELFKATLALLELGILEPRAQILGGICIFDLKDITLNHAWQVTPSVAKKVVELMVVSNGNVTWSRQNYDRIINTEGHLHLCVRYSDADFHFFVKTEAEDIRN